MSIVLKKKVLVLGSTGMLGHQVANYLQNFDKLIVEDISYKSKLRESTVVVDAMDKDALEMAIVASKPDFIVNCIGVLIKGSRDEGRAIYLNSYLPQQLREIANNINSKLIHISTDCVFSGERGQYAETDHRDGQGVYAQTKILGEIIDRTHLTLRTSIIGPELKRNGEGLFHWFMNQSDDILGYTQAIWSGVTTIELARAIKWSMDNNIVGLYHVTNNSSISKHDLLQLFKKYTNKDIRIRPFDGKRIDKSFIDTRLLMNYAIPSYEQMVADMVDLVVSNKPLYSQYTVGNFAKK